MSEITKACPDCAKRDGTIHFDKHCECCDDSGRVPDVEATLRAQLDESRRSASEARVANQRYIDLIEKDRRAHQTLRAEVARLTEELTQAKATMQVYSESRLVLCSQVTRLTAAIAERDGEVSRLTGREREAETLIRADGWAWVHTGKAYARAACMCGAIGKNHTRDCARAAWLAGCKS